jgi:hypothetical protein
MLYPDLIGIYVFVSFNSYFLHYRFLLLPMFLLRKKLAAAGLRSIGSQKGKTLTGNILQMVSSGSGPDKNLKGQSRMSRTVCTAAGRR